jgi:glycosyltransferase involved in cell wall biosynthesis
VTNRRVEFIVPTGVDDPRRPSGGNVYDRRLSEQLARLGWTVREHPTDHDRLTDVLAGLPGGALVLVDGLIASTAEPLIAAATRLNLVVLVHMPFAEADPAVQAVEAAVLNAAAAIITTSEWSRNWVAANLHVPAERMSVATPGVDPSPPTDQSDGGQRLLCVGAVTAAKGQDVLVEALAQITELDWRCTCVGALDLEPGFVASLIEAAEFAGLAGRLEFVGPMARPALDDMRARTDLVIVPSRRESYGMVATEALAAAIPVIGTDVGGHREAIGRAADETRPGLVVPDGSASALADALRQWLTDPDLRGRWRESAMLRREELNGWPETARAVAAALDAISK